MEETYKLLDLNPADTTTLEDYLQARMNPEPCLMRCHCPDDVCLYVHARHAWSMRRR